MDLLIILYIQLDEGVWKLLDLVGTVKKYRTFHIFVPKQTTLIFIEGGNNGF